MRREADVLLHLHDLGDRAILDRAQLGRGDLAARLAFARVEQVFRTQEAADVVGAERRCSACGSRDPPLERARRRRDSASRRFRAPGALADSASAVPDDRGRFSGRQARDRRAARSARSFAARSASTDAAPTWRWRACSRAAAARWRVRKRRAPPRHCRAHAARARRCRDLRRRAPRIAGTASISITTCGLQAELREPRLDQHADRVGPAGNDQREPRQVG